MFKKILSPKTWFTKDKPVASKKSLSFSSLISDSFTNFILNGAGKISPHQAAEFYSSTASIATSIDMIAEQIEQIKPVLEDDKGKLITDHPILDFLKNPNGFNTWSEFAGSLSRNYLLNRDVYMSAVGNVKFEPSELWSISNQAVTVTEHQDTYPNSYNILSGVLTGQFLRDTSDKLRGIRFYEGALKEVYHIKGYSSGVSQISGDSTLDAIAKEARQIIQGKIHNLNLLNNGGAPSMLAVFKDDEVEIDDDIQVQRRKALNEQLSGPENAGSIAVISGSDVELTPFGTTNKDMDYSTIDSVANNSVYLKYKIPLPLMNVKASTLNNLQTSIELLFDNAVLPLANTIFSGLSRFLLIRFGLDPNKFRLTFDADSLQALRMRLLNEVKLRKDIGAETVNELRTKLGREPLSKGGDVLYQPANQVPLGTDLFTNDNNKGS